MNTLSVAPEESEAVMQYLRSLTAEQKDVALAELIREAVQLIGGPWLMPVTAPDGEPLGVFVPQSLTATSLKTYIPTLTDEQKARIEAAIADPSRVIEMSDMLARLSREDPD